MISSNGWDVSSFRKIEYERIPEKKTLIIEKLVRIASIVLG